VADNAKKKIGQETKRQAVPKAKPIVETAKLTAGRGTQSFSTLPGAANKIKQNFIS
jgi:hypothetical protein